MSKPEFVYVSYIETMPEKLWEALTSSEFSRQYWFGTELRTDWKVGSPFALVMNGIMIGLVAYLFSARLHQPTAVNATAMTATARIAIPTI